MLDYKDILNKYYVIRLSAREISRQTGMSKSGVLKFIHAFEKCDELDFPLPPGITNAGIAMKVYGKVPGEGGRDESYEYPDYQQVLKLHFRCAGAGMSNAARPKRRSRTSIGSFANSSASGVKRTTRPPTLQQ